jgi:hypothetical protein
MKRVSHQLVVVLGIAVVFVFTATSGAAEIVTSTCNGLPATETLPTPTKKTFLGTPGPDVIVGSSGADSIDGLGGDDTICGGGGDDIIDGGSGQDHLFGGDGIDLVWFLDATGGVKVDFSHGRSSGAEADDFSGFEAFGGSTDDDVLVGGPDDDLVFPLNGNDQVFGGGGSDIVGLLGKVSADLEYGWSLGEEFGVFDEGFDHLHGVEGLGSLEDSILAGNRHDNFLLFGGVLVGRGGNDTLAGSEATRRLDGGPGDDSLAPESRTAILSGGQGNDIGSFVDASAPVKADLQARRASEKVDGSTYRFTLKSVETVAGSSFDDVLQGSSRPDAIYGNGGADTIKGRGGADYLSGGGGIDHVYGGAGQDFCVDGEHNSSCEASESSGFAARAGTSRVRRIATRLMRASSARPACATVRCALTARLRAVAPAPPSTTPTTLFGAALLVPDLLGAAERAAVAAPLSAKCKVRRHVFTTSITPPRLVKKLYENAQTIEWRATLNRTLPGGKTKKWRFRPAKGEWRHGPHLEGTSAVDWLGGNVTRSRSHLAPGQYHWTATLTWKQGDLTYGTAVPVTGIDHEGGRPRDACTFARY